MASCLDLDQGKLTSEMGRESKGVFGSSMGTDQHPAARLLIRRTVVMAVGVEMDLPGRVVSPAQTVTGLREHVMEGDTE